MSKNTRIIYKLAFQMTITQRLYGLGINKLLD